MGVRVAGFIASRAAAQAPRVRQIVAATVSLISLVFVPRSGEG